MSLKQRLTSGEAVYGTWCLIPSPEVINVIAKAGLDFVLVDMEHGPMDFVMAQKMIMAANAEGCATIVRVARNEEAEVLRGLDIGADGILVPHVESVADRQTAISFMKYPPVGVRGFSPYTRAGGYVSMAGYTSRENERVLTGIIIEGKDGFANIDAIIDDNNLDVVYIGTYDLSVTLGVPGDVRNRLVLDVLETCVSKIVASGKAAGCLFHNVEEHGYFRDMGIQFLVYKVDSSVLYDGFAGLKDFKQKAGRL